MTYAAVIQVKIDPASDREHGHSILNDFVIPEARELPGFENGMWHNDGSGTGMCVAVFDTDEHAGAAILPLTPAGGPPVIGSAVHEVEVQVKGREVASPNSAYGRSGQDARYTDSALKPEEANASWSWVLIG